MQVKVEFIIETDDFGKEEFKYEIEKLIADIDPKTKLLDFEMFEISIQGNVYTKIKSITHES